MPASPELLTFLVAAFVVIVIPGPSVLFVVAQALAHGRRVAVTAIVGNAAGEYVQVLAVAFGLGALAERSVVAFTIIRSLGGAYVIFLGVRTFLQRGSLVDELGSGGTPSGSGSLRRGFTVGASNPKTVVFLASILPQFVAPKSGDVPGQILILGLLFALIALASDSMWALMAGTLRAWFSRRPRRARLLGGVSGMAMVGVGASFLLTRRKP